MTTGDSIRMTRISRTVLEVIKNEHAAMGLPRTWGMVGLVPLQLAWGFTKKACLMYGIIQDDGPAKEVN